MSYETRQSGVSGRTTSQYGGTTGQYGVQSQQSGVQQQAGGMGTQQAGGQGMRIREGLPQQVLHVLHEFSEAEEICEWCADQCIQSGNPGMIRCIRLCRDVSDLAGLNQKFIARDSEFSTTAAQSFVQVARACAQECAQHSAPHCQECAQGLNRIVQEVESTILGGGGQMGGQTMGGQMGGQTMGGGQGMGGQQPTQW